MPTNPQPENIPTPAGARDRQPRTLRVYQHTVCDGQTSVTGYAFERMANPFEFGRGGTICCRCNKAVPLQEVFWIDTGESVFDYKRRLRSGFSKLRRLLLASLGLVGAIAGGAIGFFSGILMIGRVGNRWSIEAGLVGALCAAVCGVTIAAQLLPPILMRRLLGLDFRNCD